MAAQIDVRIIGVALNTEGFLGYQFTKTPVGLMSKGFINDCSDIWVDSELPITTTWTNSYTSIDVETCAGD